MPDYRRNYVPGGTYFFTCVTHRRARILTTDLGRRCLREAIWNPRKHKLVPRVRDWEWSSFHRFVPLGEYDLDWGGTDPTPGWDDPESGELS